MATMMTPRMLDFAHAALLTEGRVVMGSGLACGAPE